MRAWFVLAWIAAILLIWAWEAAITRRAGAANRIGAGTAAGDQASSG